jgi:hypothetical protein
MMSDSSRERRRSVKLAIDQFRKPLIHNLMRDEIAGVGVRGLKSAI